MSVCVFVQSSAVAVGGGDVTPAAVNWGNITNSGVNNGQGVNSAQTITGVNSPVTLQAAWTSLNSPPYSARGAWFKNGVLVSALADSPVSVNCVVNDSLYFYMSCSNALEEGNYDTGTVTVTNTSDSGATLDTFTFTLQYTPSGGGGDP